MQNNFLSITTILVLERISMKGLRDYHSATSHQLVANLKSLTMDYEKLEKKRTSFMNVSTLNQTLRLFRIIIYKSLKFISVAYTILF